MRRAIALFCLLIFLTANTSFGQLLRLPRLMHHYQEHVQWDKGTTFLTFIKEHYAKEISHPDDKHHDHQNLPFKVVDSHVSLAGMPIPPTKAIIEEPLIEAEQQEVVVASSDNFSNSYLDSIWQPPRCA